MAAVKCLCYTIFLKKIDRFPKKISLNRYLFGKTKYYIKGYIKRVYKKFFLHGSIFCLGIYLSVSKPAMRFWKWVKNGGRSCLFTTLIRQVIERVHVVYSCQFSWRCESLLRFGIVGPRFSPRVAVTMISKRFMKLGIKVYFWIL